MRNYCCLLWKSFNNILLRNLYGKSALHRFVYIFLKPSIYPRIHFGMCTFFIAWAPVVSRATCRRQKECEEFQKCPNHVPNNLYERLFTNTMWINHEHFSENNNFISSRGMLGMQRMYDESVFKYQNSGELLFAWPTFFWAQSINKLKLYHSTTN